MNLAGWIGSFLGDIRYALRQFVRNPAFTAVAVVSLALGIGLNTAIFSVINAALLKLLPARNPNKLVMLTDPGSSLLLDGLQTGVRKLLSYAEFVQLREGATTMSEMCASELLLQRWPVRVSGGPREEARGRLVTENYFSAFGIEPAIGRFFTQQDGTGAGKDPYAVISYDYWQRRFGGRATVLGTPIRFFSTTVVVIGVAARNFRGETVGQDPDLWLPMMMQSAVMPGMDWLHENSLMWLHVFGRRKASVTIAEAQAEVSVLFHGILETEYPATMLARARKRALDQHIVVKSVRTGAFSGHDEFSEQWTILSVLAGLVLLISCANVANLLLAHATARSREVAIRLSIGATKGRLVRQVFTGSLMLAVLGSVAGILVAAGASRTLPLLLSDANDSFELAASIDSRVLGFTACAALLTGVLFGLAPALRVTQTDLNQSLKETGRNATGSGRRATFAMALIVAQVALSVLLVMGAGLFMRTLWNLQSVALGYPANNLLLVEVDSLSAGYRGARGATLYHELAGRIGAIPGVLGVTYSSLGLFSGLKWPTPIAVTGFTPRNKNDHGADIDHVGPGYFSSIGIPVLLGREIARQDMASSPHVCVVNEAFAKRFFSGRNPIGGNVTRIDDNGRVSTEVVGVAKDARDYSLRGDVDPKFYVAVDQKGGSPQATFEIRTTGDPKYMLNAVRKAILDFDADLPISRAGTLDQMIEVQNAQPKLIARLCTIFAVLALVLAATGIYGVLSYSVARRTSEIGIRVALGAGKGRVMRMILKETGIKIFIGMVIGVTASAAGARLVATQLYRLGAMDPLTFGIAVSIVGVVALIAAYIPAARAAKVDPVRTLRHE